jgi:DNA polymerase-4
VGLVGQLVGQLEGDTVSIQRTPQRTPQPTRERSLEQASWECPVLHVDMDAFYASVAIRDRPELHDVPVVVGGGYRGVVLSANYPARRYGIRSAMPMTRARRLCPDAVVVSPGFETFEMVSRSVMENFRQITPVVEVLSLDEAFLDVSGSVRRLGSPYAIAERLRARIYDEQGITCSVGMAATVSVAKLASRRAKPDGIVVVPPSAVTTFLHPLDVGELWGVGEKTTALLHRLGLMSVGDVAHTPLATLQRAVGVHMAEQLHQLAWGADRRRVTERRGSDEPDKSMGADETFGRDTDDRAVVLREVLRLSAKVAARLRTAGVAGRTVTLKVRFADFTTITRSRTRGEATDVTQEIYRTASDLFLALGLQRARIRLVGVRVEGLVPRTTVQRQLVLGERERGWSDADVAVDRATQRFGTAAVRPATLLGGDRA